MLFYFLSIDLRCDLMKVLLHYANCLGSCDPAHHSTNQSHITHKYQ